MTWNFIETVVVDNTVAHVIDGDKRWTYGPVEDDDLGLFRLDAEAMWAAQLGGTWVASPRDGDPRTFDVKQETELTVYAHDDDGIYRCGVTSPRGLAKFISDIEVEWTSDDGDGRIWEASVLDPDDDSPDDVNIYMTRRPLRGSLAWSQEILDHE